MKAKTRRRAVAPPAEVVAATINETRSVAVAAKRLKLSRQGVYLILERAGLQLVREKCRACGGKLRGKVVAEMRAVEKAAP